MIFDRIKVLTPHGALDGRAEQVARDGIGGLFESLRSARGMSMADIGQRVAASDSTSGIPAMLLTQRLQRVMEKPFPFLDMIAGFENVAETPIGAESVEYAQVNPTGTIGRLGVGTGQGNIPQNGGVKIDVEYRAPAYFCSVVSLSLREQQAMNFLGDARLTSLENRIQIARNVHLRAENAFLCNGYELPNDPYGVLDHPGISRLFGSIAWSDTSNTGQDVIDDVGAFINYLNNQTSTVASTRRVVIASKLINALRGRTYSAQLGDTLWALVQRNFPEVTWVESHQLNGAGPNGEHGMIFQDTDWESSGYLDVFAMPQLLPVQRYGFDDLYYMWHASAGFKSFQRFAILVGWVPAS